MGMEVIKDKEEYLRIIVQAAALYKENLLNKNMLIIYEKQQKQYFCLNILFLERQFLHLTGVRTTNNISSKDFFQKCISRKLTVKDFEVEDTWTTTKKMNVIIPAMSIYKNAKMVGDFQSNGTYGKLYTEKVVGNERGCLGFKLDDKSNYMVPNTLLQEDIRDITTKSNKLVAIYMKDAKEPLYNHICYLAKSIKLEEYCWTKEIEEKIVDKEDLIIDFKRTEVVQGINKKKKKKPKKATI